MKQKKNKGISLIVLIITIVVIIILATAIIVNLAKSNIIGNANEAVFRNDVKSLKTELEIYVGDKISDTLGKYDREKLNADENIGKYGEEEIEDKNKDGKTDIYDVLESLKESRLKGKVYVEKGKLVFNRSGLTEEEKKIIQDEGIEINGIPSITEITYESTLNSIKVNVILSDISEVEKYKYILDGGKEEESSEATKEYTGLKVGTNYILEVIAVLKDGTQISKKQIITTKSIEGNIEYILSETELTANDVTVELKYEREIPEGYILECRVGEGDYQEYKEKITITENTTIYGRLYNKELEDAKIESSINISNIDKEPPTEPVIVSKYGYPILTIYGVEIDGTTTITYDTGYGITNLYSLDNGTTWKEYTESFNMPGTGTVMAKSVKANGLETAATKAISMPADSLGPEAYDGDDSTYSEVEWGGSDYIVVDPSMCGKKVRIKISCADSYNNPELCFLDKNGKSLLSYSIGSSNLDRIDVVPENTVKIRIGSNSRGKPRVYEIEPIPIKEVTKHYPKVTEYGVEPEYSMIQIIYNSKSVQRLYKIDDGEWAEYKDQEVKVKVGETIYSKGIDKDGNETKVSSYTPTLLTDAIGKETYDGDKNTSVQALNKYFLVSEEMSGKYINIKNSGYMQLWLYDASGNNLKTYGEIRNENYRLYIEPGTTKIKIYTGLYEIYLDI